MFLTTYITDDIFTVKHINICLLQHRICKSILLGGFCACLQKIEHLEKQKTSDFLSFSSAKSSHPKKTGCTTKSTTASTSTPRSRASKDTGSAAQNERTDAKTNRKSDTPTSSSVPQKASAETLNPPGDLKSSALSSDTKPISSKISSNDTGGAQGDSVQDPKSSPDASRAGENTHKGAVPGTTSQSSHVNTATENTSFGDGEARGSSQSNKQERTKEEGGGGGTKKGETENVVENSRRYCKNLVGTCKSLIA